MTGFFERFSRLVLKEKKVLMGRFHLNQINCNNLFYSQSRDFPSSIRGYVVGFKRVDQRQPSIFRRSLCGDFSSLLSVLTFVFCKLNSFQITEMAIKISARQSVFDITGFQFLFCLQQKNTTFVSKKRRCFDRIRSCV